MIGTLKYPNWPGAKVSGPSQDAANNIAEHAMTLRERAMLLLVVQSRRGGVRIDGSVVSDRGLKLEPGTYVMQVGKRKFARVVLAG